MIQNLSNLLHRVRPLWPNATLRKSGSESASGCKTDIDQLMPFDLVSDAEPVAAPTTH
jgi:hypothetical protein